MVGIVTDGEPFETPASAAGEAYATIPVSRPGLLGGLLGMGLLPPLQEFTESGPVGWFAQQSKLATTQAEADPIEALRQGRRLAGIPESEDTPATYAGLKPEGKIDPREAQKRYAPNGEVSFDKPIAPSVAAVMADQAKAKVQRDSVLARWANTTGLVPRITSSLVAGILDPINDAAMFVPGIGEETFLAGMGRIGLSTTGLTARLAARGLAGAVSTDIAMSPLIALQAIQSRSEGDDFTLRDAMYELAFNAALGAMAHAGTGLISRSWRRGVPTELPPDVVPAGAEVREPAPPRMPPSDVINAGRDVAEAPAVKTHAAMSAAVAQVLDGREVDVRPIIEAEKPPAAPMFQFKPSGNAELDRILGSPELQRAVAAPQDGRIDAADPAKINRKNRVPYGAGASNTTDITNVDEHVPPVVVLNGVRFDPAIPVSIHEQVEKHAMEMLMARGMSREDAYTTAHHLFAEPAERQWVEAHGIDWTGYQRWWDTILPQIQHENPENLPPDLYRVPYPHLKPELARREPAGPVPEPTAAERHVAETGTPPVVVPPGQPAAPINIAEDVAHKVEAAGLPVEVAQEAGNLWAERYRARAAWFNGARGTAEDLYRAEAPDIVAGGQPAPVPTAAAAPVTEYAQRGNEPGPRNPGVGVEEGNKLGFAPELRVKVTNPPELPRNQSGNPEPLITQTTTNNNAPAQLRNVDRILRRFRNATASVGQWARMQAFAFASDEVPVPPYAFIRDVNGAGAAAKIRSLTPGQIEDANHGFNAGREMRAAYLDGTMTPVDTGKLFMWSFLSRGVSPYVQEGMFIDAYPGADQWLQMAAHGNFTKEDLPAYLEWAQTVAPKGSGVPGAGAKSNLNDFGRTFLLRMSARDAEGVTNFQRLHDMLASPTMTGPQIRREFLKFGEGVGIDNKVVSFTLLVAGHHDVMVVDRVQTRQLWDDGRFADVNLYDGQKEDGKVITGTALSNLTYGARGLLIYEAVERALAAKVGEIYAAVGRPEDASIGRYHWETWVAFSEQEASHGSLGAILADAIGRRDRRNTSAISEVVAKEGEYGAYSYGARYGVDVDGASHFVYTTPSGNTYDFSVPAFREFLADIKKPGTGVVPGSFKVTESGNAPWYARPEVDRDVLDQRAAYWADRGGGGAEGAGARHLRENAAGQSLAARTGFVAEPDVREFEQRRRGYPLAPRGRGTFSPESPNILEQAQKGKIRFEPGKRPIITLNLATADASTFIHESGHDFLEQLMRDAAHELAPDQLKADAQTTLKWFGVESADQIKTPQHEKFARGFEQFVREGVAPSPGLANVFAKFRGWLLSIYQTIKGLGRPISEDIRQVFDRLLAVEPQRQPLPTLPELASQQADMYARGFAPGIPQADFDAMSEAVYGKAAEAAAAEPVKPKAAVGAGTEAHPLDAEIANLEQALAGKPMAADDLATLEQKRAAVAAADLAASGYEQAAQCLVDAGV